MSPPEIVFRQQTASRWSGKLWGGGGGGGCRVRDSEIWAAGRVDATVTVTVLTLNVTRRVKLQIEPAYGPPCVAQSHSSPPGLLVYRHRPLSPNYLQAAATLLHTSTVVFCARHTFYWKISVN